MISEEINNLTHPELIELMVKLTGELLTMMNQKEADGTIIRDKRSELQLIRAAIENKRAHSLRIA